MWNGWERSSSVRGTVKKAALTDEENADRSPTVTDLGAKAARRRQHYTWVIIQEVSVQNWMVDRLTLPTPKAPVGRREDSLQRRR
jgi:phenylpyruvate tautomerase PptA (4-oxalocrotonate tautomerase family)